jgi:hypothetical protein
VGRIAKLKADWLSARGVNREIELARFKDLAKVEWAFRTTAKLFESELAQPPGRIPLPRPFEHELREPQLDTIGCRPWNLAIRAEKCRAAVILIEDHDGTKAYIALAVVSSQRPVQFVGFSSNRGEQAMPRRFFLR